MKYPVTPDGRYFVVRGRLWRMSNPALTSDARKRLTDALMAARRDVGVAKRGGDVEAERNARDRVDENKRSLGERGAVWWSDDAPDLNRRMARHTSYASWFDGLNESLPDPPPVAT